MPRRVLASLAAFASTFAASVAGAAPCIPQTQAEALVLATAPSLIGSVAAACATSLPPSALLRARVGPLTAKFADESERAWPRARDALKLLTGPGAAGMLEGDLARPMVLALIAPLVAKEIKPANCPDIDRVLTLAEPLPPRNTAALVVTLIEITQRGRTGRETLGLQICRPSAAVARP